MTLDDLLADGTPPVVAILRGLQPHEAPAVGAALIDAGVRIIEVPFNSPDPLESIAALQAEFGGNALIGGGTVLSVDAVEGLHRVGGRVMVTPNTDPQVISRGAELGLEMMPGFMTPSEAFAAIKAGARRIKLFPAARLGASYVKAVKDVLPRHVGVWAVGGTDAATMSDWLAAGCEGIGVGGALYKPGYSAAQVGEKARELVAAWKSIKGG